MNEKKTHNFFSSHSCSLAHSRSPHSPSNHCKRLSLGCRILCVYWYSHMDDCNGKHRRLASSNWVIHRTGMPFSSHGLVIPVRSNHFYVTFIFYRSRSFCLSRSHILNLYVSLNDVLVMSTKKNEKLSTVYFIIFIKKKFIRFSRNEPLS